MGRSRVRSAPLRVKRRVPDLRDQIEIARVRRPSRLCRSGESCCRSRRLPELDLQPSIADLDESGRAVKGLFEAQVDLDLDVIAVARAPASWRGPVRVPVAEPPAPAVPARRSGAARQIVERVAGSPTAAGSAPVAPPLRVVVAVCVAPPAAAPPKNALKKVGEVLRPPPRNSYRTCRPPPAPRSREGPARSEGIARVGVAPPCPLRLLRLRRPARELSQFGTEHVRIACASWGRPGPRAPR